MTTPRFHGGSVDHSTLVGACALLGTTVGTVFTAQAFADALRAWIVDTVGLGASTQSIGASLTHSCASVVSALLAPLSGTLVGALVGTVLSERLSLAKRPSWLSRMLVASVELLTFGLALLTGWLLLIPALTQIGRLTISTHSQNAPPSHVVWIGTHIATSARSVVLPIVGVMTASALVQAVARWWMSVRSAEPDPAELRREAREQQGDPHVRFAMREAGHLGATVVWVQDSREVVGVYWSGNDHDAPVVHVRLRRSDTSVQYFERSVDSESMVERLRTVEVGGAVPLAVLEELARVWVVFRAFPERH